MKRLHVLLLLLWLFFYTSTTLNGQQTIELQVVGAAGAVLDNSVGTLHFTIGELMVTESQNDNNSLPQGFHQIVVSPTISSNEPDQTGFNLSIYPNPSTGFLKVETDMPVQISLFDLHGRLVLPVRDVFSSDVFDIHELAVGTYFLHAADSTGKTLKTSTILLID